MTSQPPEANPETRKPGDFRILVVDDEEAVCQGLCDLIKRDGYRVKGVGSAREALEILQKTPADLVLTDLMMPEINGWQLLRAIKKHYSDIPVIVFTGYISQEAKAMLTDEKAEGYFTKPVDHARLQAMLKAYLFPQNLGRQAEVVVIENDSNSLRTIEHALIERGLYVHRFQEAKKALVHIRNTPPDLVITEMALPDANGLDLCQTVFSNPDNAQLPVLMIASQPPREDVIRAIQLGIKGVVLKPLDPQVLSEKAVQVLRQAGSR